MLLGVEAMPYFGSDNLFVSCVAFSPILQPEFHQCMQVNTESFHGMFGLSLTMNSVAALMTSQQQCMQVHNESFHGMFGLVNLHGIPKPSYRAYQLLHETGTDRLPVHGPVKPTPPLPPGTCSAPVVGTDVWGGDV
jgi:hypothetical protein